MDFQLSDEQQMIQETVRRFGDGYDFEQRRILCASAEGFSREHWRTFAELGWLGIGLPAAAGGFDGCAVDEAIVLEQFGRALVLEPYLSCMVLAARALAAAAPAESEQRLAPVLAGERLLALAHGEPLARGRVAWVETEAVADGRGGYRLRGHKSQVLGGPSADLLLVSARTAGDASDREGISLFAVDAKAAGIERQSYRLIDGSRAADITLRDVAVPADALLGEAGSAFAALDLAYDHAILGLCAEALGNMERALWLTRDYLKTRKQYGVALASFQSLQHRMADMLVELEQSRSMLFQGFAAMAQPDAQARRKGVSATKVQIGNSGKFIGANAVQLHGGIGVTEEYIVGHLFKRLAVAGQLFGNTDFHLQRFAAL